MRPTRTFLFTVVLFLLPIAAAAFGWSVPVAIAVVVLMLLWRWLISIMMLGKPDRCPQLQLDTIAISHFVEKVRWNLDLTGLDYIERQSGGTLGAFFLGRTVPRLRFKTGAVRSDIGNSAEILRYLWGRYSAALGERIAHLEPTPERVDFETRLDHYGVNLQVWAYYHLLSHRDLTLRVWGADSPDLPYLERLALRVLYPVQKALMRRAFRISESSAIKVTERINALLEEIDTVLADGRQSILGGDTPNYTDYTFAAMTGVWLLPEKYGGGRADHVRLELDSRPEPMQADIRRWIEDYPRVIAFTNALYDSRPVHGQD